MTIISTLTGGIGNQMFQYAAARALSLSAHTPVALCLYYLNRKGVVAPRRYELGVFDIHAETLPSMVSWWHHICADLQLPSYLAPRRYTEDAFRFDPHMRTIRHPVRLHGYWQNEKYFADVAPEIRRDFTFRPPLRGRNLDISHQLQQPAAISVHLRRADYASDPATAKIHGVCTPDYYQQAVSHIRARIARPVLFFFSDDIAWTRAHLKFPEESHYIDWNTGESAWEDMRLMSLCRHHIIANSSFSWWGAWLNPRPDKIVIAPRHWFVDPVLRAASEDIIPPVWIRI